MLVALSEPQNNLHKQGIDIHLTVINLILQVNLKKMI